MFGRKAKRLEAQAEVLDDGTLVVAPKLAGGYAYATFEYRVSVRPPSQLAYDAVARGSACTGCKPERGDVIRVTCSPNGDGDVTFEIDGDERYDPVVVARQHVDAAVEKEALYSHLEDNGTPGMATVVAVRAARHRFLNVEIRSTLRVTSKGGDEFETTIVEWVSESFPQFIPKVGEKRAVLFDAGDRSKVAWRSR